MEKEEEEEDDNDDEYLLYVIVAQLARRNSLPFRYRYQCFFHISVQYVTKYCNQV
jgi:hypothetical protein